MNILAELNKYEPRSLRHEVDVVWDKAEGYHIWDIEGKKYIDFTSGIFVANVGHSHPEVRKAISAQELLHSYVFPNELRAKLVKKLSDLTGMEKVFLCSTGSEAIEAAMRCMWAKRDGDILALKEGNHGRTYGPKHKLRRVLDCNESIDIGDFLPSGIVIETYIGYNAQFHLPEWIQQLCKSAQENDVPVCFDEIQAGFGRTGKMFGYEHYNVKPDLVCLGKALSGNLPISAVCGRADLLDAPDDLSSTHTGNPVCCAAALANLKVLEDEGLVARSAEMGEWLEGYLPRLFPEYSVQGRGMVWAIDLENVDFANRVVDKCAENGLLLVKTHRGTIKIAPPLVIQFLAFQNGVNIIREAINECA